MCRYYTDGSGSPACSQDHVVGFPIFSGTGVARLVPGGMHVQDGKVRATGWHTQLYYLSVLTEAGMKSAVTDYISAMPDASDDVKQRCMQFVDSPPGTALLLATAGLPFIVQLVADKFRSGWVRRKLCRQVPYSPDDPMQDAANTINDAVSIVWWINQGDKQQGPISSTCRASGLAPLQRMRHQYTAALCETQQQGLIQGCDAAYWMSLLATKFISHHWQQHALAVSLTTASVHGACRCSKLWPTG